MNKLIPTHREITGTTLPWMPSILSLVCAGVESARILICPRVVVTVEKKSYEIGYYHVLVFTPFSRISRPEFRI